ncbi:MAG: SH3 domain-containing protein [Usitatibacteraceae bacterium]
MKIANVLGILAAFVALVPATATAEWGRTAKDVNLRAGPASDYPVVTRLPRGIDISVEGCLSDYRWCDVVAGPDRGWV